MVRKRIREKIQQPSMLQQRMPGQADCRKQLQIQHETLLQTQGGKHQ